MMRLTIKTCHVLFLTSVAFIISQESYGASALSFESFFGTEEDIEELPNDIDIYNGHEVDENGGGYGYDVSTAARSLHISDNYPWLPHNVDPENNPIPDRYKGMPLQILGNKKAFYEDWIKGCKDHYGTFNGCESTEKDRVAMNVRQPPSMQNYTELGFKKIKAPQAVFELIEDFWEENKDKKSPERWNKGNTYTNHWTSPTYMVSVEDTKLRGAGTYLKNKIWNLAQTTLQEWTGEELTPCSLYGVRMYTEGSVLATHVDRMPLVSSAILNVAQDVDEPWPIEVYGHDGKPYNVTMEPGDMVLYESHSILHGRPFPLKGRFYANIFIHFEPVGHSLRHNKKLDGIDVDNQYRQALAKGHGGHENDHEGLPAYILTGSEEAERWKKTHKKKWSPASSTTITTGSTDAHSAASAGDVESLKIIAEKEKDQLHKKDVNGWQPIHEGARGGHTDVLLFLVQNGANINERTNQGRGGSPLFYAQEAHGKRHASVKYLNSLGAQYIEPEL